VIMIVTSSYHENITTSVINMELEGQQNWKLIVHIYHLNCKVKSKPQIYVIHI
jgi:hypothetical protein